MYQPIPGQVEGEIRQTFLKDLELVPAMATSAVSNLRLEW
jgi:hypothetical protein